MNSAAVKLISDEGKGRAFVFISEANHSNSVLNQLNTNLATNSRLIKLEVELITENNWQNLSREIIQLFSELKIRQASIIASNAGTSLAQNICLLEQKLIRSLVLINPVTKPHPTKLEKITDYLESFLPLGLPLRNQSRKFDSRPFLQRLRSPVLVFLTTNHTNQQEKEAELLVNRAPTAWKFKITDKTDILDLVNQFEKVPVKCPQKNKRV